MIREKEEERGGDRTGRLITCKEKDVLARHGEDSQRQEPCGSRNRIGRDEEELLVSCCFLSVKSSLFQGRREKVRKGWRGSRRTAAEKMSGFGAGGSPCGLQPCFSELLSYCPLLRKRVPAVLPYRALSVSVNELTRLKAASHLASAAHHVPSLWRT